MKPDANSIVTVQHEGGDLWVYRLTGLVKKAELDAAQISLWQRAGQGTKIRQLVLLEDFQGWEKGAAWGDLSLTVAHGDDIEKMAIVGDPRWETEVLMFVGAGVRRTLIQFFSSGREAEARRWLATI